MLFPKLQDNGKYFIWLFHTRSIYLHFSIIICSQTGVYDDIIGIWACEEISAKKTSEGTLIGLVIYGDGAQLFESNCGSIKPLSYMVANLPPVFHSRISIGMHIASLTRKGFVSWEFFDTEMVNLRENDYTLMVCCIKWKLSVSQWILQLMQKWRISQQFKRFTVVQNARIMRGSLTDLGWFMRRIEDFYHWKTSGERKLPLHTLMALLFFLKTRFGNVAENLGTINMSRNRKNHIGLLTNDR